MSRCFAICWPNLHIHGGIIFTYTHVKAFIHQQKFRLSHQVRLHFDALQLRRSTYWWSAYGATRHLCGVLAGSCFQGVSRWMWRLGGIWWCWASRTGQLPVKVENLWKPSIWKKTWERHNPYFSQSPKISLEVASILIIMTSQYFTSCKCCEYLSHKVQIAWF